ncbi:hypothetical protein SC171_21410 [Pantoea cypripedii]|uniref:hypothetical protein n=1 Tax=Pantoea cypripedii TaxID=55209 RepID=UPI002FC6FECE
MTETPPNYDKAARLLGKSAEALCKKDPPKLKEMDEELREILQGKDGAKMEDELRQYMHNNYYQTLSFATITAGNVSEIRTISLPKDEKNKRSQGLILNTFTGPSKDDCEFVQKKYTDSRDIEKLAEMLLQPNTMVEKPVEQVLEPLSPPPAKKPRTKKPNHFDMPQRAAQPAETPANGRKSIMVLTKHHND